MTEQFVNYSFQRLVSAIGAADVTYDVSDPTKLPATGTFRLMIGSEITKVTSRSGATVTVVRGAEGTTAAAYPAGTQVIPGLTAEAIAALGGGGGTSSAVVFQPGGVASTGVYTTWADTVAAAVALSPLPVDIVFDDNFGSCQIPTGAWDFGRQVTFQGGYHSGDGFSTTVLVADGATFTQSPVAFKFIYFVTQSNTAIVTNFGFGNTLELRSSFFADDGNARAPIYDLTANIDPLLLIDGAQIALGNTGGPMIQTTSNVSVHVYGGDSQIEDGSVIASALAVRAYAFLTGSGSPETAFTAEPGSLYSDRSGGDLYLKKTGSGKTGWALVSAPGPVIIGDNVVAQPTGPGDRTLVGGSQANGHSSPDSVVLGTGANDQSGVAAGNNVAVGRLATIPSGSNSVAVGLSASAGGANGEATAVGHGATASAANAVAIGHGATASKQQSTALGPVTTHYAGEAHLAGGAGANDGFSVVCFNGAGANGGAQIKLINGDNGLLLPDSNGYYIIVLATGYQPSGGGAPYVRVFEQRYFVRKTGGALTITSVGVNVAGGDGATAAWTLTAGSVSVGGLAAFGLSFDDGGASATMVATVLLNAH